MDFSGSSTGSTFNVLFDNIAITYPFATVSITNVVLNPAAPLDNDPIAVTATLAINGFYPDTLIVTNYWKPTASTNWTAIPMSSNQPTVFITISNIPGQPAYSAIDYFAQSTMTADGFTFITNSITNTIAIRPRTAYTSMVVTNSINAPLTLSANYQWQGVTYVSNTLSTFKFSGISNGVNTLWGDSNQIISNQLAFGNADAGATDIILSTTNIGLHLFTFNESDFTYRVRPCVRENFETWTNQPFGTYTNQNQWILTNGSVSNDAAGSYSNNYATLNSNATAYLLSPLLNNGIGHISFWYRKWGGSGGSSGSLSIQVAPNPASTNWTTIASVSNITATTYSFINIPWADLNNQAVRILNSTNAGAPRISLDEVVISAPGASVAVTNTPISPTVPLENDSISVTGMLALNGYLDSLAATNYWKLSSSTNWAAIPMASNQPSSFLTISNIPNQLAFTPIDYFVQAKPTIDGITAFVNSPTNTFIIRPRTSYSTMVVTNSINAPLTLSSTYQWQGVTYVSNTLSTFKFSGTSNGVNTLWGDSNQAISNQLAFGNADIGAGNIILTTTNIGLYLFTFNESDFTYRVRPCVRENFETWTNQPFGTYTNQNQWILTNGSVSNDAAGAYSNNYATLNTNATSYLLSPILSNGIGHISFWYRKWGTPGALAGSLNIQVAPTPSSPNWTTIASISNITSTTYSFINIPWADLNNQAVRILNNTNAGSARISLDEVVISAPGASVAITNVALSPSLPTGNDSISVSTLLALNGYIDTIVATNFWKPSSSSNWTPISMASNQPSQFTTVSTIPTQPTFASIDYYVQVKPIIDGIETTNNFITSLTNTVVIRPQSGYSSMVITNSVNAPLTLVSNNQWQGIAYVSNTPSFFKFKGTSNGVNTLWGDSNQAISNLIAYGNSDVGATDIILATTNIGLHLFTFNESNLTYSARACVRENFETWSNQPLGTYTNPSQWILNSGAASNDVSGAYSGRYAILSSNTTSYLLSPLLSNGIGHISFWYRKWGAASTSYGALAIQVAPTPASTNWVTIASITNISATYYSFINIPWADLNNQAVRILSDTNSGNAAVSLDEVVIAAPGAAVYAANLTNSPSTPGSLDFVNIAIDLTTNTWATINNVMVWYRGDTNLLFQSLPMVQSGGNHYTTTNGVPPFVGTVQYAVSYSYSGILGASPVYYPTAGTNQPYSYTSTNTVLSDYRYETFDSSASWGPFPIPSLGYINAATNITGWVVSNASIKPPTIAPPSSPNACRLGAAGQIISPVLSNGVGSVVFYAAISQSGKSNQVVVESSIGNGPWTPSGPTNYISMTNWTSFTNTFKISTNCGIRLRQMDFPGASTGSTFNVFFDNIYCTPYPANIVITNFTMNPGYPAAGQSVMASCDVLSINPNFPAFSYTPMFYWYPSGGTTNSIPMVNAVGNTYTTTYPFLLTNVTRDVPVTYWVSCRFVGYHAVPADDLSPRASATNSFTVQAYSSSFSNVAANINGANTLGRLITNGLWQSIVTGSSGATNLSLAGLGYSSGAGYSTNVLFFGNSNNWQTALPLADMAAGTNPIPINLTNGQYMVRYDEATGLYLVERCAWQNFDQPGAGDGTSYQQSTLSSTSGGAQQNFDLWTVNTTLTRSVNFDGSPWSDFLTNGYISGLNDSSGFVVYSGRVVNIGGPDNILMTASNITGKSDSFIAQGSHWGFSGGQAPLRGIGQMSYNYQATSTNVPASIAVYLADPSIYDPPVVSTTGITFYTTFQDQDGWRNSTPVNSTTNILNTTYYSNVVVDVNTSTTYDVIVSQIAGTQSLRFASVSVSEWYDQAQQTNSDGWISAEYWIEPGADTNRGNVCRFDVTRAANPTNQFLLSPRISGGIKYIQFDFAGVPSLSQKPPTNITVNFTVELTDNPAVWTNTLDTISTNFLNNTSGLNYYRYFRSLQTPQNGLYVRIRNTTPKPGVLLLDNINIPGYATTNDWYINNVAIDYKDQTYPPWPRQYFRGVAYLNNTRIGSSLATGTLAPDTNSFPQIRTPLLSDGIGEISFRYRNWATSAPLYPAKLVIQAAQYLTGHESDWTTTITNIPNILNTNDYLYFSTSIYDTSNHYVRIYNDDTNAINVGRMCLDEVLVTAPLASSLCMSNLVITPSIPIYTNTVDISVDVYRLFLNPQMNGMTGLYSSANSYTGLSVSGVTKLPMTCIASNLSTPGKWFRYKTSSPISALPSDTFVKYSAQASFSGYHTEVTSPMTNRTFGSYPRWLAPLDALNGTNQAFYVVLSCPTGSVWINEINTQDLSDFWAPPPKFVEICGLANVDLAGWSIQVLSTAAITQDLYVITNSFVIPSTTNGFGFFVLGDSSTSPRDMTLTNNTYPRADGGTKGLPDEGGIRLIRKTGIYADAISFAGDISYVTALTSLGFTYAGNDSLSGFGDLSLTGTGSLNSAFAWASAANYSIGLPNDGQYLQGTNVIYATPPTINIVTFVVSPSNIWIECSGGTNGWGAAPWYSTNLMNTNGWVLNTPFSSTLTPSNTYQVTFSPTNLTPFFCKIVVTNGP